MPSTTSSPARPRRASVRVLLLSLVLSCLIPGVIGIGALVYWMYRSDRAQTEKNAIQTARALMHTLDAELVRAVVLAPKDFAAILRNQQLPADWIGNISDRTGTLVARTNLAERFVGGKANPDLLRRLGGPLEGAFETVTIEGIPALMVFSRSPTSGWSVAIGIPKQVLAAPWLHNLLLLGLGASALFATGGLFAWRQGGKVSRSVDGLRDATVAMADGQVAPAPELHFAEAERAAEAIGRSVQMLAERNRALQMSHAALLDREGQLAEAQRLALIGSWYWDAVTDTVTEFGTMHRVFGCDEILPFCKPGETAYLPDACLRLNTATRQAKLTGQGYCLELEALHADGSAMWVEARAEAARSAAGAIVGLRGTMQDITAHKQAEQAHLALELLGDENRQILAASRVKNQFLANMSHELRTPLNAIIGFADLLHSGAVDQDPAKRQLFLGHIGTSGRHLLQLINDVLDLAKVESGQFEFFPEPVDLRVLIKECCDVLHSSLMRQKIDLTVEIDAGLGPLVLDPARLKQAMYNYLSNAIKFTPAGGSVKVRALPEGRSGFRIEVEDTGIGIAAADLPRLFHDFAQLNAGDAKQQGGAGLGLALTRRLLQAQGGDVGVRSTPGQGSVFHLVMDRIHAKATQTADV